MAVITGMVRAKSASGMPRVDIELDGEHWVTCPDAVLAEFRLYKGLDVGARTQTKVEARVVESELFAACHQAVSRRQLTEQQLRDKLLERGHSEALVGEAIRRCRQEGLVDDARYARAFVESRLNRDQGARRIRSDLLRRGVAAEHIDSALDEVASPTLRGSAAARALVKRFGGADLSDRATEAKARQFLLRRGFDYHEVDSAVRLLLEGPAARESAAAQVT